MWADERFRAEQAEKISIKWADPEYRRKQTEARADPEWHENLSEIHLTLWDDPARMEKHLAVTPRGEGHYNWQGGIALEPYGPEFTEELKLQIRTRDAFCCLVCGKPENGTAWDVHHCDYNKKNNDPDNLATLCKSCHGKTGTDRPYWQAYFTGEDYHLMLGAC